jgi:predicted Zn-dependent protease
VFLLERTGEVDTALEDLRGLLSERPGDAVVQNALGYTLADHERELARARDLVTQALAQMPDSSAVLDSMGWVLYREGMYEDALRYLQRARERGSDPEIYLHLGEAEWKLDRRDDAISTWEAGLERYPGNPALQERLERARR